MMKVFTEIGTFRHLPPTDKTVWEKIGDLQNFITENHYACSNEIFRELGKMYVDDERFKRSIDRVGGDGTAEFARHAIEIYCSEE